ncbi:MAG: hypothetical protein ACXWQA_11225 [Pseudobdellovibrionaceae bacterium]
MSLLSCWGFAQENKLDLEINCRPVKDSEYFRAFSLRLRLTETGYKLVADSASASPSFEYIKSLEMHPQVKVISEKNPSGFEYIKEVTLLSGDEKKEQSAALDIHLDPAMLYYGRLQLWWPGQTSSLREKVQCFLSDVWSNSQPVIP